MDHVSLRIVRCVRQSVDVRGAGDLARVGNQIDPRCGLYSLSRVPHVAHYKFELVVTDIVSSGRFKMDLQIRRHTIRVKLCFFLFHQRGCFCTRKLIAFVIIDSEIHVNVATDVALITLAAIQVCLFCVWPRESLTLPTIYPYSCRKC